MTSTIYAENIVGVINNDYAIVDVHILDEFLKVVFKVYLFLYAQKLYFY